MKGFRGKIIGIGLCGILMGAGGCVDAGTSQTAWDEGGSASAAARADEGAYPGNYIDEYTREIMAREDASWPEGYGPVLCGYAHALSSNFAGTGAGASAFYAAAIRSIEEGRAPGAFYAIQDIDGDGAPELMMGIASAGDRGDAGGGGEIQWVMEDTWSIRGGEPARYEAGEEGYGDFFYNKDSLEWEELCYDATAIVKYGAGQEPDDGNPETPDIYTAGTARYTATSIEDRLIRKGPGKGYPVLTALAEWTYAVEVGYNRDSADWVCVDYGGLQGWMEYRHLQTVPEVTVIEDEAVPLKPAIYLYPEEATDVLVELDAVGGRLTRTEPAYGGGWRVRAYPDGTLVDRSGGVWPYLFWEGRAPMACDLSEGFVVRGEDAGAFLAGTLAEIGLQPHEAEEFIAFWAPKLRQNPYNLISFQYEGYEAAFPLTVTPAPDSVLRVFMAYKPLDAPPDAPVPPQTFAPFSRNGFTVVEWGGCEVA
ncbi:MAG: hypothetical protein LBR44_05530 [Clostridiales Family XIII bacterium]|jgi:hypothetical protein|nr:hypothetical protein [Clostridiales Family XIII bacterium]